MKRIILLFFIYLPSISFCQTQKVSAILDSLKFIENMPYICHNLENDLGKFPGCGDAIFWKVVREKLNIVDSLIQIIDDTTRTLAPVPNFGGNYTVGDIAYSALSEIIFNVPTFKLLGVDFDAKGCGFCTYWKYLRKDIKHRTKFKNAIKNWYKINKEKLVWIMSNEFGTCDCSQKHPNGGHYEVKE